MKEDKQKESTSRRGGSILGTAIRIAFAIWILAGVVWAAVSVGEVFQIAKGSQPAVVTDALGNQVIVYQASGGGIDGRIRTSHARAIGVEFLVSPDPEATRPAAAVLRSGGFIVAWESGAGDSTIVARRFHSRGRAIGVEFLVGNGQDPAIGIDDRDVMVAAWTTAADAKQRRFLHVVRRFEASGRAIGVEFLVGERGPATPPALAVQDAGRFLVVWEDDRGDLLGQAFDVDGTPLGDAFLVNESGFGDQESPAATVALDGDYTVVWERVLPDSQGRQVFGRRIAAGGRAIGVEFLVSEGTSTVPTTPAVMADERGHTVVTWVSQQDHGSVRARQVALEGRAIGVEFLVDASTTATAVRTSRGGDTADFVVIWQAEDGGSEPSILGRDLMLDPSGND